MKTLILSVIIVCTLFACNSSIEVGKEIDPKVENIEKSFDQLPYLELQKSTAKSQDLDLVNGQIFASAMRRVMKYVEYKNDKFIIPENIRNKCNVSPEILKMVDYVNEQNTISVNNIPDDAKKFGFTKEKLVEGTLKSSKEMKNYQASPEWYKNAFILLKKGMEK